MPYLSCSGCRLTHYSAATQSVAEHCPRCGGRLLEDWTHFLEATRRELHRRTPREEFLPGPHDAVVHESERPAAFAQRER